MHQPYLVFRYVCYEISLRRDRGRMTFAEHAWLAATCRNREYLLFQRSLRQAERIWIRSSSIQVTITNINDGFSIRVPGQFTDISSIIAFIRSHWPSLK